MKPLFLACLLPAVAGAQSLDDGAYDVHFQELSRQGELTGCSLVFTALVSDYAYKRGERVRLDGNITLQAFKGTQLAFTAKLGTKPLISAPGAYESPTHFYITTPGGSTAGRAQFVDGELPGFRMLFMPFDQQTAKLVVSVVDSGQFRLGFNRKDGGIDVVVAIDTTASIKQDSQGNTYRAVNRETPSEFGDCVGRLVGDVQRRLSAPPR